MVGAAIAGTVPVHASPCQTVTVTSYGTVKLNMKFCRRLAAVGVGAASDSSKFTSGSAGWNDLKSGLGDVDLFERRRMAERAPMSHCCTGKC